MNWIGLGAACSLTALACAQAEELELGNFVNRGGAAGSSTPSSGAVGQGGGVGSTATASTSTGGGMVTSTGGGMVTGPGAGGGMVTGSAAGTGAGGGAGIATGGTGGVPQDASVAAGGRGGAAGSAAPGGSGGLGGSAGSPSDAAVDRPGVATTGFALLYKAEHTQPMANAIKCELTIDDAGPDTVALSELSVRYYFTNEVVGTPTIDIGFSGLNPGFRDLKAFETARAVPLPNPTFTADTYIEFAFTAGAGSIAPGQSVIIAWQYHGPNFPLLTQTNDHSFDATKTTTQRSDRVVLVRNGNVIWGTPP